MSKPSIDWQPSFAEAAVNGVVQASMKRTAPAIESSPMHDDLLHILALLGPVANDQRSGEQPLLLQGMRVHPMSSRLARIERKPIWNRRPGRDKLSCQPGNAVLQPARCKAVPVHDRGLRRR